MVKYSIAVFNGRIRAGSDRKKDREWEGGRGVLPLRLY